MASAGGRADHGARRGRVRQLSTERFYDEPRYYDIAFGWDPAAEVDFFEAAVAKHAGRPVHSVIEFGCGPANMTVALAKRGYTMAGLDLSRPMLDFARAKVSAAGLPVELFLKDMAEFALYRRFDGAACFRNTLSYLNPADRAATHFEHAAHHLEPGGVYVIDLSLVPEGGAPASAMEEWAAAREQVRVHARWELIGPWDPVARTTRERITLQGEERGWQRVWEQESVLRLYSLNELIELAGRGGYFALAGTYQGVAIDRPIADPETAAGRVLVVLTRTSKLTPRAEPVEAEEQSRERRHTGGRGGFDRGRDRRPPRRDGDRRAQPRPRVGGSTAAPDQAAGRRETAPAKAAEARSEGPAKKRRRPRRRRGEPQQEPASPPQVD